ncbi:MAG: hypothetical protein ACE5GW_02890 [Planctomycetota bacterium]
MMVSPRSWNLLSRAAGVVLLAGLLAPGVAAQEGAPPPGPPPAEAEAPLLPGAAEEPQAGDDPNPFFSIEDIPPPRGRVPVEVHGRIDLTLLHFDDRRNVDGFPRHRVDLLSPAVSLEWNPLPRLFLRTEVEYDGLDSKVELDQLLMRTDIPQLGGYLDVGLTYVPFGIERFYYSPPTNPLVDRPSPFRRIFPGSYSDVGLFLVASHGGKQLEAGRREWKVKGEFAVTRGLRGPDRDDRPDDLFEENDELQVVGRLGVEPFTGFQVGASGLIVHFDVGSTHRRLDLIGIDATWRGDQEYIRAEMLYGTVERGVTAGGDFERDGLYIEGYRRLTLGLPWLEAVEGVVRFDSLDENSKVRDFRDVERWAFGLNVVPRPGFRVKSEIILSRERGTEIDNDGFLMQAEVHF